MIIKKIDILKKLSYINRDIKYSNCKEYDLKLSEHELNIAKTVYWIRNKKLGYNFAVNTGIYVSPRGFVLKKNKCWFPHPYYVNDKFHPYGLYRHCQTFDHIKYLARYKAKEILVRSNLTCFSELLYIMSQNIEDLPLIINDLDSDGCNKLSEYCKLLYKDRLNNSFQME